MRLAAALFLFASPALAWEASSTGPVCLLSHDTGEALVQVSHDPRNAMAYSIHLKYAQSAWSDAPLFAIRFEGPGALTISTDRHRLIDQKAGLVVSDSGFGNVLRGLEANHTALAILGDQTMAIPLDGAAPEVAKFRACTLGAGV